MADPQTTSASQQGWVQFAENRRYNPATGQVQYDPSGNGNWQDIGTIPLSAGTGSYWQNARLTSPNLIGQLPSQDILRQIAISQQMAAAGGGQAPSPAAAQGGGWGTPSYLGAPQINMGGVWQPSGGTQAGTQTSPQTGGTSMATTTAGQIPTGIWGSAGPNDISEWQTWFGNNVGKTILVNGQPRTIGTDIQPNEMLQAFQQNTVGWGSVPGAQAPAQAVGGPGQAQPESVALQQMGQIDPTGEALRQALGQSYLTNLGGGPPAPQFGLDLSKGAAAPAAGDVQSYLDLYKQIDPQGYAQRVALAGGMDQFVQNAQAQAALGSQLDPGTIREVEQGTRAAQIARGNVYGTPQLVAETMARGSAGEQRMLQRQQMLQSALGQQQSYLGSGLGLGDVANTLYNQGYNRYLQGYGTQLSAWQAQQNARLQSQGAALGYLGSGQTPYQAGASYYDRAQQQAAMAAQGGPQYNPASLGQQYTGAGAPSFPQYGLDMSQLAGNWYNNINNTNLQAYNLQQAYGQKGGSGMGAATGALGGAASGALAGSAAGPWGTLIGAGVGAVAGGLSGYSR
jgi:hypothetical protein